MVEGKPDNTKERLDAADEEQSPSSLPAREAEYIEETEQAGRDLDHGGEPASLEPETLAAQQSETPPSAILDAESAPPESAPPEVPGPESGASEVQESSSEPPAHEPVAHEPRAAERPAAEPAPAKAADAPAPRGASPILALVSGAVGAAMVLGGAWFAVGQNLPLNPAAATSPSQGGDSAALDALTARVASVEAKVTAAASAASAAARSAPDTAAAAPDPALIGRVETLEKSLTALHDELAAAKEKTAQLAAAVGNLPAAPAAEGAAALPAAQPGAPAATAADLAAVGERLGKLEAALTALPPPPAPVDLTAINERLAKLETAVDKPAPVLDDSALRRAIAATLLESAVQHGEAYGPLLSIAKPLAPDPAALAPLETFATTGVPTARDLCRDLLALLPKLIPGYDPLDSTASILDRLQAGADRLVRIQRPGSGGAKERSAVLARMITAAQRNDLAEAKRELSSLEPSDRAPAQAWLDRANTRDAALSASRQFAAAALAALSKSSP